MFELHNSDFLTFSQGVYVLSSNRPQVNKFQLKMFTEQVELHEGLKAWLNQPEGLVLFHSYPWNTL